MVVNRRLCNSVPAEVLSDETWYDKTAWTPLFEACCLNAALAEMKLEHWRAAMDHCTKVPRKFFGFVSRVYGFVVLDSV